jgi:prevent-host-death family protein
MKFVTVRDIRLRPGDVWKTAQRERDIIITSNGKPVAILTAIKEDTLEEELDSIRRARALNALDYIHRKSIKEGTDRISEEEIEEEIRSVRKVRKN